MAKRILMPFLYPPTAFYTRTAADLSFVQPSVAIRHASGLSIGSKKTLQQPNSKKKKARKEFINQSLKDSKQFALCDAIRYIKAFEVGRSATSSKYDLAVRLRTLKNGPVVRSRVRLPHAIDSSIRICVICPPNSPIAEQAIKAGASITGEDEVFDAIKAGKIEFDRCICHPDSSLKLNTSGVARILGPRQLMPSAKLGTITKDITGTMKGMSGGSEYRERLGVVRCAVGQLANTPEEMQANIKVFITKIKEDIAQLADNFPKDIHEVVLSSTNSPGFSLNGDFRSPDSLPTKDLAVL